MTSIAENVFKERLQTIDGVSEIRIWGAKRYAMRLWIDPERLSAYNLTPLDIQNALNRENIELPTGMVEGLSTELTVRTQGRLTTLRSSTTLSLKRMGAGSSASAM
jgi:multidrug efflux pump subunit AcrB